MRKLWSLPFAALAMIACICLNSLFVDSYDGSNIGLLTVDKIDHENVIDNIKIEETISADITEINGISGSVDNLNYVLSGLVNVNKMSSAASYAEFMDSKIDFNDLSIDVQTSQMANWIKNIGNTDSIVVKKGNGNGLKGSTETLEKLISTGGVYVSFLAIRLRDCATVAYNIDESNKSWSIVKAPMCLYACKLIDAGRLSLKDSFTYTSHYYSSGSGVIKDYSFGTKISVKTLIRDAIVSSDNVAHNMLFANLNPEGFYDYIENMGAPFFDEDRAALRYWPDSTARNSAIWWTEIYKYKDESDTGKWLWDLFGESASRIRTALGNSKDCYTKTGSDGYYRNEVGIVMGDEPYLISFYLYSRNTLYDFNRFIRAIDELICS